MEVHWSLPISLFAFCKLLKRFTGCSLWLITRNDDLLSTICNQPASATYIVDFVTVGTNNIICIPANRCRSPCLTEHKCTFSFFYLHIDTMTAHLPAPQAEEMDRILESKNFSTPKQDEIHAIADRFTAAREKSGQKPVLWKQVTASFQSLLKVMIPKILAEIWSLDMTPSS